MAKAILDYNLNLETKNIFQVFAMLLSRNSRFFIKYLMISGLIILVFGLRFFGLNWDQNTHLHPDERFLTMVTESLKWPETTAVYFQTQENKLNPNNVGHEFFVYGTWPLVLTKFVAEKLSLYDYTGITLVGRALSAGADFITCILVILIAAKLVPKKVKFVAGVSAGLIYGLMIPAIQQAHFFTTDTFLVLSLTASFYLALRKPGLVSTLGASGFFGLAVAAKISGILFGPILGLIFIYNWLKAKTSLARILVFSLIAGLIFFITLRIAYPSLFESQSFFPSGLNPRLLANWSSLKGYDGINTPFPPALQWIPMMNSPYLVWQFLIWGIGLPIGLLGGFLLASQSWVKLKISWFHPIIISMIWILGLTIYQSSQFAKTLRYLFPILPFIAIITGFYLQNFLSFKLWKKTLIIGLVFAAIFWTSSFFQVYLKPHTRVAASNWIFENIPDGSAITFEYWDDGLPVSLATDNGLNHHYQVLQLPLYDPDSFNKWQTLSQRIAQADYIIISSNRLWRSISALPKRYPMTTNYYQKLFNGNLGFTSVAQFANYPCLIPGEATNKLPQLQPKIIELTQTQTCALAIANDGAEEAFTVYDHPTVLIFQNTQKFSADKLFKLIRNSSPTP